MTAFRSAFESAWPNQSPHSSSESWGSDNETPKRFVGFPEVPADLPPSEISRMHSCSLEERPKRQSSLAQQLALSVFEQGDAPKLKINTKTPLKLKTSRNSNPTHGQRSASSRAASMLTRQHSAAPAVPLPPSTIPSNSAFQFSTGTLPSGGAGGGRQSAFGVAMMQRGHSSSGSTEAVAIPQGLSRACTAPEPLPELDELSPELRKLFAVSPAALSVQQGDRSNRGLPVLRLERAGSRPLPNSARGTPTPRSSTPQQSQPQSQQVESLREALRQEQEEVARLRREMAKMSMAAAQKQHRGLDASGDVQMTPVTPDAAEKQQQQQQQTPPEPTLSPFEAAQLWPLR